MTRRGFLTTILALPFAAKLKPKVVPKILYRDADSVVYDGWPDPMYPLIPDHRFRFVLKIQTNALYGKFASSA